MGALVDDRVRRVLEVGYLVILCFGSIQAINVFSIFAASELIRVLVYGVASFILMFIGAIMGAVAKKSIRLNSVEWYQETREVTFEEYKRIEYDYRKEFGRYFDDIDSLSGCCCTMMVPLLLSVMLLADYDEALGQSFWLSIYPLVLVPILFAFLGLTSFKVGYFSVSLSFKGVFSKIDDRPHEYIEVLNGIDSLEVIAIVDVSRADNTMKLNGTKWYLRVFELPDTVSISLEIDDHRWTRPYLVAYIEGGPQFEKHTEVLSMETACPAIIKYSNDENKAVLECRYDFKSPDCDWSGPDYFEYLVREFTKRLREIISTT